MARLKRLLLAGAMLGGPVCAAEAQPPSPLPTALAEPPAYHPGAGPWSASRISGIIGSRDYPTSALRNGHEGDVRVTFLVGRNGRVRQCDVESSSGSAALDLTTCGLILRRFRYDPARDANGWAIEQRLTLTIEWRLPDVEDVDESDAAMAPPLED